MVEANKPKAPAKLKKPMKAINTGLKKMGKKKKYPFCYTEESKRNQVIQMSGMDFSTSDRVLHHMMENAESMFQPKMVLTKNDWLESRRENG